MALRVLSTSDVEELVSRQTVVGQGVFGVVSLVPWENGFAILKVMKTNCPDQTFQKEKRFLEILQGAGGAPLLLGVCSSPKAIVITFRGHNTLRYVLQHRPLPDWYLAYIAFLLGFRLQEVHAAGVIHRDIHVYNVLVTVPQDLSMPWVSIIDYGLATMNYSVLDNMPDGAYRCELTDLCGGLGRTSSPSPDISALGELLNYIFQKMSVMPESAKEVVEMARTDRDTKQATLDEIVSKLYWILSEDFKVNIPSSLTSYGQVDSFTHCASVIYYRVTRCA
ncbi:casein kinase I-like [Homarus americanus]|uniref:casein kinase I-like n=1 Tax=Homarus americanus TaxID=6706 RepID=UPI001C47CF71|nr:casein kinase I-like [Homarus americanus]